MMRSITFLTTWILWCSRAAESNWPLAPTLFGSTGLPLICTTGPGWDLHFLQTTFQRKKSDKSLKWPLFYVKIWNKFYLFLTLFHIIWKLTKHEQLWHHPWITHLRSPILYHWARRTQWWRRSVMRFIWHTSCILLD